MDAGDRELFARGIRDAMAKHTDAELDRALDDLGWSDALSADTDDAIAILFEQQGASNATSSALDRVIIDALGGSPAGGVVLPALGGYGPPATLHGDELAIDGLARAPHDQLLVVAHADDKDLAAIVAIADLDVRPVRGIDPSLGLLQISGAVEATAPQPVDWTRALAPAQRALAHELVGASRTMLALACEHAINRIQFGQPIAKFQAVRHRLAETLVAIETATAALDAAAHDRSATATAMAKAIAGRSARTAARHCQQVLAGIGFTTEHPLHRYIKRAIVLDQLLGSSKLLTRELGDQLLRSRQLPPPLPL